LREELCERERALVDFRREVSNNLRPIFQNVLFYPSGMAHLIFVVFLKVQYDFIIRLLTNHS